MANLSDVLNDGGTLKTPGLSDAIGESSNKKLMADARMALSGNWGMGVLGWVLYCAFSFSLGLFSMAATLFVTMAVSANGTNPELANSAMSIVSQVIQLFLSGALMVGVCSYYLVIAQEGEARLECLFTGFKRFWTAFGAYFLSSLFILLRTLLILIVPALLVVLLNLFYGVLSVLLSHPITVGVLLVLAYIALMIYITFRYAMVYFIVADDDEEVGALEAIRQSKQMMTGNKWKFFCLNWRFFGWGLLATFFTLGIGYLWLMPYMQTSFAKFYEDVK